MPCQFMFSLTRERRTNAWNAHSSLRSLFAFTWNVVSHVFCLGSVFVLARKGDEHHLALGWKVDAEGVSVVCCSASDVGHSDKRFGLPDNPLIGVTLIGMERLFDQPRVISFTSKGVG